MSKRDAILEASAKAIAERGVRGLRVNDVADYAGVSTSLLYYHFTDRDGLLRAALFYVNDRAIASRMRADVPGETERDRLVNQLLIEFHDEPDIVENARAWHELRASAIYEEALRAPMIEATRMWHADIAASIRRAQEAGEVTARLDADEVALALTIFMEGLDGRWLSGDRSTEEVLGLLRSFAERLLDSTPLPNDNTLD
jgi:AcrR family transcriptional regulator